MARMDIIPACLEDVVAALMSKAHRNIAWNIIGKLVLSVSIYFVWQERNIRLYKKGSRPPDQVATLIKSMVRLKIMSIHFKNQLSAMDVRTTSEIGAT